MLGCAHQHCVNTCEFSSAAGKNFLAPEGNSLHQRKKNCCAFVKFLLPHKTAVFVGKHHSGKCGKLSTADGCWEMMGRLPEANFGTGVSLGAVASVD